LGRARRLKKQRFTSRDPVALKLSECLVALVQPYRQDDLTRDGYQKLITVASVAWNVCSFPPDQRERLLERSLEAIPMVDRPMARALILEFIVRKNELFPDDRRFIANATVTDKGSSFAVQVASIHTDER
jgi:hypothetical protein